MNWVEQVVRSHLASPSPADVKLGRRPDFASQLGQAGRNARTAYWICVGMLLVLFVIVLTLSTVYFEYLTKLGVGGLTAVSTLFGVSGASCVTMMMRWSREAARGDVLLVLLNDLRARDPRELDRLVIKLAHKWYGLGDAIGNRSETPSPSPGTEA